MYRLEQKMVKPMHYTGKRIEHYAKAKEIAEILKLTVPNDIIKQLNKLEKTAQRQKKANEKKREEKRKKEQQDISLRIGQEILEKEKRQQDKKVSRTKPQVAIVQKGKKYLIDWQCRYYTTTMLNDGTERKTEHNRSMPSSAQSPNKLPKAFNANGIFTAPASMTYAELDEYMLQALHEQYSAHSPCEDVITVSLTATPVSGTKLSDIRMGRADFAYKSIDASVVGQREGTCVIDYILYECQKPDTQLNWITRPYLEAFFNGEYTTKRIVTLADQLKIVSVYAVSPLRKVFCKVKSEKDTRCTWIFIVNGRHLYPIVNDTHRHQVSRFQKLELGSARTYDLEKALYLNDEETYDFIESAKQDVVLPVDRLEHIAGTLMNQTKSIVESFSYSNGQMCAFKHPAKDIMIIAGKDYKERKALCDKYFKQNKVIDFKWANQSWGKIGRLILDNCYTEFPKSHYNSDIFVKYPISAYHMCNDRIHKGREVSIDIRGCYTSILIDNNAPWNVFGEFDAEQPYCHNGTFLPGEYYINRTIYLCRGTMVKPRGFYPAVFVEYCLDKGYIRAEDITYVKYADRHLPADTFRKFAQAMSKLDDGKMIVNSLIGCFGTMYHRKSQGAATLDIESAVATAFECANSQIHQVNNLFIVEEFIETMKTAGDLPIYRQIIASSLIKLDEMIENLNPEEILGYNTDCIKIRGKFNSHICKEKTDCQPGDYHVEKTGREVVLKGRSFEELEEEAEAKEEFVLAASSVTEIDESEMDIPHIINNGGVFRGIGGSGKSYLMGKIWNQMTAEERAETIVVGYTHVSCENLKGLHLIHNSPNQNAPINAQTIKSVLFDGVDGSMDKLLKYKRVIIDEFGVVPQQEMAIIHKASVTKDIKVLAFGDTKQTKAIADNWIAYDDNKVFLKMCGNTIVNLQYKADFARYDIPLYEEIVSFLETKTLNIQPSVVESYENLCVLNTTRRKVNQECLARWVKEHNKTLVSFGSKQVCEGLPMMCYDECDKSRDFYKTQVWIITSIGKRFITLTKDGKALELCSQEFTKYFDYSFCITVYKCQGMAMKGHFNIWDGDHHLMTSDVLYTAISRGKKLEYAHIVTKKEKYEEKCRELSVQCSIKPVTCKTGRIYRLRFHDNSTYIGKTKDTLEVRLAQHILSPTNEATNQRIEIAHPTIELVEEFNYSQEKVLSSIEKNYIEKEVLLGGLVLNVQHNKVVAKKANTKVVLPKAFNVRISEDASKKRYEVRCERKMIEKEDRVRRFPWGNDKASAYAKAEEWRNALKNKYY